MQIENDKNIIAAISFLKSGNDLPPIKTQDSKPTQDAQPTQERPTVRELAQTIDPTNMSRNDAAAIGDALAREGKTELAMFFLGQSMVLNENRETASESDPIMNEKFNMFDSLQSQIEVYKSKGTPTDTLEKAMVFLEKFTNLGHSTAINERA